MVNNIVPENIQPAPEQKIAVKSSYSPEKARRKLGKYFIDERVYAKIRGKTVKDLLDGRDIKDINLDQEKAKQFKRVRGPDGKLKPTTIEDLLSVEDKKEIAFVKLVKRFHNRVTEDLELKGELLKDHEDKFLDSLSIGILYRLSQEPELAGVLSSKDLNFPDLMDTEQFKTAKKTALLALAEESLTRMEGPGLKEIDSFQKYLKKRNLPEHNLSDKELKNLFIAKLEDNPEEFLQDYYINSRFSEDEMVNSRNIFKFGEIVADKTVEVNKNSRTKVREIGDFLKYEDKEHGFAEADLWGVKKGGRYWGEKLENQLEENDSKSQIENLLHKKIEKEDQHRSEKALLDRGILKENKNGDLTVDNEFFKTFSEFYENEDGKPNTENQMVLGLLYSVRKELGVGVLSRSEVLRRASEIIPGLQRVGNDLLTNFIRSNLKEFYPELSEFVAEKMKAGELSQNTLRDLNAIVIKNNSNDYSEELFQVISKNRGEFTRLFVNDRNIDGFGIGEAFGNSLKRSAGEKKASDDKSLAKLEEQTGDENAVYSLLIEGKEINDPKVRDRVERTMGKVSHFSRWVTGGKVALQKRLFYSEGDSPFATKPDLLGKGKSVGLALFDAAVGGHMYNYFFGDPVNRGYQGLIMMADYFIRDEIMPLRRELKAKKKEVRKRELAKAGLIEPNETWLKKYLLPLSKDKREYRKKYKQIIGSYWNPLSKYNRSLRRYINKEVAPLRREINQRFWHNKEKLLYSMVSYGITSWGANAVLNYFGLSGPEAWMVLMATNVGASSLLSGAGLRTGAEFIVNAYAGKKAVDGGIELLTDYKKQEVPQRKLRKRRPNEKVEFIKKKGKQIATSIASRIVIISREGGIAATSLAKKIKLDNYLKHTKRDIEKIVKATEGAIKGTEEENRNLAMLKRFIERKNNPEYNFSKQELIETVEFLNWMKEEQELLLIHNPSVYSERLIRQPDGSFLPVDNREGLNKIDVTRREIVEYAQNNLAKEDYDEVFESSLDFFSDIKSVRTKVAHRRIKYLGVSYGYRVGMMILSHLATESGGLLEEPINKIFGDATMDYQHIIEQAPTTVFHANKDTPQGREALAKEVWARTEELNNLVNLMGTSEQLSEFQPGIESHLAYYGFNQQQIELLVDNLAKSNLNTSDLMRVIYVLSSYKEGQEYLATVSGFEGTERRNLAPMITNIAVDPVGFIDRAMEDKGNATLILLKYPDIAEKLGINHESMADQINPLVIPESVKEQLLTNNVESNPIVITTTGPQIISVGNVATEFVDGLSKTDRQSKIDFLIQMNDLYSSHDNSMLQEAVNNHYAAFLADANLNIDLQTHPLLSTEVIKNLPGDSVIYKIYHLINPQTDKEIFAVTDLLNKAKSGDANAYHQLFQMIQNTAPSRAGDQSWDQAFLDNLFETKADSRIYEKILDNLPSDEVLRKDEIVRRIQQEMIGMSLRPVGAPVMGLEEIINLARDPDIFSDPHKALIYALSPGNSDLEMAVAMTGKQKTLFVQNDQLVGTYQSEYQVNAEYGPEDIAILKAIEGAESDNDRLAFPRIIAKNVLFILGQKDTASGTTPPAGSLIEMMTGDIGRDNAMNPEAPAALHNYDAYGPGYLSKLIIAHFRGRVPEELLAQMGPDADLTQSINDKDPSWIDRLCNKFESLIAEKALVAKYGEDKVYQVYLNHVTAGTFDGIQVRGETGISEALFAKPFNELTLGEKFLVVAVGQSPGEYLYDYSYDAEGKPVSTPNPVDAIEHAIYIIEQGKAGDKLDKYLPGKKEQILAELHQMLSTANPNPENETPNPSDWKKVFPGELHLPSDVQNFAATPDAARYMGMTDEQIAEAINNGEIKSVIFTNDGIRVIELNNIVIEETSRAIPESLMLPYELTPEQRIEGQLAAQYSAAVTGATLDGNFYTTADGTQIPAWWTVFKDEKTGQTVENVIPGMAMVMIGGEENAVSMIDPTGSMSRGPQLVGSIFKPLVVYYAVATDPTYANAKFDASPIDLGGGNVIRNSVSITDNAGMITLPQSLASSSNTSMYRLWESMSNRDPNFWEHFQKFSKDQFGIVYYEVNKDGQFVPLDHPPFPDAGFGNIYVGGVDPDKSGLIAMAEAYQKIGEAGYLGQVDGNYDIATKQRMIDAAKVVLDGLTNEDYKRDIPIWTEDQIKMFSEGAGKTGTQSGVDKYGNWIAIRAGTYFMKYYPEVPATAHTPAIPAHVEVVGVMMAGKDPSNNNIEVGWGGEEALPITSNAIKSSGTIISPELAENAVNSLFINPEVSQNYQLGAVDIDRLYPFIKSLSSEDQYAYLREAIRSGDSKYLFVDLIGGPIDGKVQPISIHFIDKDGVNKIFTLSVPANLIEPAGPVINQFSDTSSQTVIVELLTHAVQSEPEKYGGLLTQLQGQGINFVSLHDYEASPALFAIHEQMEKNGMLFSGAEDSGMVMMKLGLNPATTVFVNDELFKALHQENPDVIKEMLFIQREYLAMAAIYEASGQPGTLDSLLYDPDMTSSPQYQLLRIFAETKSSQIFQPNDIEKNFLLNQFQNLIKNPEKADVLAHDVITAYNLYNEMSSGIARGEMPTQIQSKAFIEALNNFETTTNKRVLLSLGIGVNPPVTNATPLPASAIDPATFTQPHFAGFAPDLFNSQAMTSNQIIEKFLKHPEQFDFSNPEEKASAILATNEAVLLVSIVESSEARNLQGQELINYITQKFQENNIPIDPAMNDYISLFSYNGRQCGAMNLMINNILAQKDPQNFHDLGSFGGDSAKSFIGDLLEDNRHSPYLIDKTVLVPGGIEGDYLYKRLVTDFSNISPGDSLVIAFPWLDNNSSQDNSHIAEVILKGVENGKPYILIFESNANSDGVTGFRKVFDLQELIPDHVLEVRSKLYPNPEEAARYAAIFGIVRYESGQ